MIGNSLVEANKYLTASTCFNMRVVECKLAAIVLAKHLGVDWKNVKRLIDVSWVTISCLIAVDSCENQIIN